MIVLRSELRQHCSRVYALRLFSIVLKVQTFNLTEVVLGFSLGGEAVNSALDHL